MNRYPTQEELIAIIYHEWITGTSKEEIVKAFWFLPGFNDEIFRKQLGYLFDKWEKEKQKGVWQN